MTLLVVLFIITENSDEYTFIVSLALAVLLLELEKRARL